MASLDKSLLYRIMRLAGEIEGNGPDLVDTGDFLVLIGQSKDDILDLNGTLYLDRHLVFLQQTGFLSLGIQTYNMTRIIKLTAQGHMFLQPELAEFGNESLLPDIIKAVEERIQTLTYPQEEKEGLMYRLREAATKQGGEALVKNHR